MISISMVRTKDGNEYKNEKAVTPAEALSELVECELAFYTKVTDIQPTKLVTKSCFLGVEDVTTFQGTVEEMKGLLLVTRDYLFIKGIRQGSEETVPDFLQMSPEEETQIKKACTSLAKGGSAIRVLFEIHILGGEEITNEQAFHLTSKDVTTALSLKLVENYSSEDIRTMLFQRQ